MLRKATWAVVLIFVVGCDKSPSSPSPRTAPQRLAVLGDSLAVYPSLDQSFPKRLQARITSQHLPWTVINAAVSGDTTADGLRRAPGVLADDIALLVVELGANDGLRGVPTMTVADNLTTIIHAAQQRNIRVLLCGMEAPPTRGLDYTIKFHDIFPSVAERLRVPLAPFILAGIVFDPEYTGPDLVHPNAAGAQRIADNVWPYLQPLL